MPDLIEIMQFHCLSAETWSTQVSSRSRGYVTHTVTYGRTWNKETPYAYTCTCEKFTFTGNCHHIGQVREQRCGWQQFMDGGHPYADEFGEMHCPLCHGPVNAERWGV